MKPRQGSVMPYDYDIIVIGAGPAGMAAAIRARWVKTAEAVPASVALLDPAGLGGIAIMGQVNLTGPSFGFHGPDLIARLAPDVEQLEIPVLREAATGMHRDGEGWAVVTPARTLRCLAVVVAVGLRRLGDEARLRAEGRLKYLAGGYARSAATFRAWSHTHEGAHLLLIGGADLEAGPFAADDGGRNTLHVLREPAEALRALHLEGERVRAVTDGREVRCDMVMLDYHTLELRPPAPHFLPASWRTPAGYCALTPGGIAGAPGVYAAGDCAGQPSLCVKALAQGAEAGFSAYRHVYRQKFGAEPPLFAFYASPERPPLTAQDLPELDPARHLPVGLTASSAFPRVPSGTGHPLSDEELATLGREVAGKTATVQRTSPQRAE